METSSPNFLLRKQSSQHSQLPPRDSHLPLPCSRTFWGRTGAGVRCGSPLPGALWVLGLQSRGCGAIPGPAQLPAQPAKPQMGSICALRTTFHISPPALWKNPCLDSPTCSVLLEFSQHNTLPCSSVKKRKWSQTGAGQEPGSSSGCPKQLLLKDHYSTQTVLSWLEMYTLLYQVCFYLHCCYLSVTF